jgi:small subunit ribosomal protein S4
MKGYYGSIGEKQFHKYYQEAVRRKGDTGENLIELLERRLSTIVYRAKFVPTVFAARQFVNHGHVLVNGKRVNVPSYSVRDGDEIQVDPRKKDMDLVLQGVESAERDTPDYIEVDHNQLKATFMRAPKLADVPFPVQMEPNLVIEYYSR